MITPPESWRRGSGAHLLTCAPPSGRASVRFHERVPLRPFRRLVDELIGEEPDLSVWSMGPVERLVTDEGEYAAWVALHGSEEAGATARWVGAVFLDDFAALLDARSLDRGDDRNVARVARRLLAGASFGLGLRRRRFLYASPAGWLGVPAGLTTTWYPPEFPRRRAMLVVYPAEPSSQTRGAAVAELLDDEARRGFVRSGPIAADELPARNGIGAQHLRYRGHWPYDRLVLERQAIVLDDGRYRYVARLEAAAELDLAPEVAALVALALSVEPVPGGAARPAQPAGASELAAVWSE